MLKYQSKLQAEFTQEEFEILSDYLEEFKIPNSFTKPEHFATMNSAKQLKEVLELTEKFSTLDFDFIIFVGIGGANLGVMTYYLSLGTKKEIVFMENVDPIDTAQTITKIQQYYNDGKKALLFVASKSGSTTETMTNFSIALKLFKEIEDNWKERIIATTLEKSILDQIGEKEGFFRCYVPEELSDRYSVMGISAQVALSLAGIDVKKVHNTIQEMNQQFLSTDFSRNSVLQYAANLWASRDLRIINYFIFSEKLKIFGAWQKQLFAESLGKTETSQTPIVSVGSTDLHSMTQLYLAGPQDKYTSFISIEEYDEQIEMDSSIFENTSISRLKSQNPSNVISLIEKAVKTTYAKQQLIFDEIILKKLDTESLTELLQFQMITVGLLGKLWRLNSFDQPAVELYKDEIRDLL